MEQGHGRRVPGKTFLNRAARKTAGLPPRVYDQLRVERLNAGTPRVFVLRRETAVRVQPGDHRIRFAAAFRLPGSATRVRASAPLTHRRNRREMWLALGKTSTLGWTREALVCWRIYFYGVQSSRSFLLDFGADSTPRAVTLRFALRQVRSNVWKYPEIVRFLVCRNSVLRRERVNLILILGGWNINFIFRFVAAVNTLPTGGRLTDSFIFRWIRLG